MMMPAVGWVEGRFVTASTCQNPPRNPTKSVNVGFRCGNNPQRAPEEPLNQTKLTPHHCGEQEKGVVFQPACGLKNNAEKKFFPLPSAAQQREGAGGMGFCRRENA